MTTDDKVNLLGVAFIVALVILHIVAIRDAPEIASAISMRNSILSLMEPHPHE